MKPTIRVRRCQTADFDDVLSLLLQLWPDKTLDTASLRTVYEKALASDSQEYLCATVDEQDGEWKARPKSRPTRHGEAQQRFAGEQRMVS